MHRLIFLDIDGVLNSHNSGTCYTVEVPEKYGIDNACVDNLFEILDTYPDIKVVIHSGWIKHRDNPEYTWELHGQMYKTQLPKVIQTLGDHFLDCVDYIPWAEGGTKEVRIRKWIKDHVPETEEIKYAIIDDDSTDMAGLKNFTEDNIKFFNTKFEDGLTKEDALDIIKYFA